MDSSSVKMESPVGSLDLHQWNEALEASIVNDFFNPPVAGRIYTYPNIAAYEVLIQGDSSYRSLGEYYEGLSIPKLGSEQVDQKLGAMLSFYYTGFELVYSVEPMQKHYEMVKAKYLEQGGKKDIWMATDEWAKQVAQSVLMWASKDGYKEMRSYDEYTPLDELGKWKPTPPDYSAAMEPHWSMIRSFALDSASQFRPEDPTTYDLSDTSQFYRELMEVYEALKNNNEQTEAIAKFWDCNPLVKKHQGHVTFAEKKLTPGGHWVNIGRNAMKKEGLKLTETSHTYVMLTLSIHDAFVSCWEAKYATNYIRPVTVIHEHYDQDWNPILYTPNFPEYPSGHSVVSGSAATFLTATFGENYSFIDSTEVPYGMPPRSFNSFFEASDEAAISRLHGGIHFMPAIENGKLQGRLVGKQVMRKLVLKR